jgi:molecular chaperone DnaK
MIFQTEKQLKEYGDKLSADNKSAIESALTELRTAHQSKDITAIDAAMERINNAWQAASQEMYAAQGGGQPGADAGFGGQQPGGGQPGGSTDGGTNGQPHTDNVTDVDYEEVDGNK